MQVLIFASKLTFSLLQIREKSTKTSMDDQKKMASFFNRHPHMFSSLYLISTFFSLEPPLAGKKESPHLFFFPAKTAADKCSAAVAADPALDLPAGRPANRPPACRQTSVAARCDGGLCQRPLKGGGACECYYCTIAFKPSPPPSIKLNGAGCRKGRKGRPILGRCGLALQNSVPCKYSSFFVSSCFAVDFGEENLQIIMFRPSQTSLQISLCQNSSSL